jgi:lipoprotein-anchoring transpeptidase ErfK/SrfK
MSARQVRARLFTRPWLTPTIVVLVCVLVAATTALVVLRVEPSKAGASSGPARAVAPLALVASTPAPGATDVPADAQLSLQFSAPLAADGPQPALDPPIAGTWTETSPETLAFEATGSLPPGRAEQLTVPGGTQGVQASDGARLSRSISETFTVAPMSVLRLQQLLAQLDYLPLSFTPASSAPVAPAEMATAQLGSFTWRWSTLPGGFTALWSPGEPNTITTGAVMSFESQHGLSADGDAGPDVWSALLSAAAQNQADANGNYAFVEVATSIPEHVDVWSNGAVVYSTLANTGIEAAPTEVGTWPVFARYTSTTMSGTNPDGSHYDDPGVPWVSYFHGGDALHGFNRASYGVPQSLGCVEMPPANAEVVFPYTPIGTLVTVNAA